MRARTALSLLLPAALAAACGRPEPRFSESNARAHVNVLAGAIGSRPIGTEPNRRAREYLVDQLGLYGYDVRVQETDARRPEAGLTARVANVIAVKPGARRDAVALVAHYDSVPDAPGAADDGLGTAVMLEAARVLGARPARATSLMILLTDGEEAGLMGAAAVVDDREVRDRVRVFLNIDSIGSSGPSILFESGPGNAWLVRAWARHAPRPRGGSFAREVYRRLPNDTDFTVLTRLDAPGLNFAPIADSYAYHTDRDTPDRLSPRTLRQTGANIVAIVEALDRTDLARRDANDPVYFEVGETAGLVYGQGPRVIVATIALLAGLLAWARTLGVAGRLEGYRRLLITAIWTVVGTLAIAGAMFGSVWALRAGREVLHPWYAHPNRAFSLMVASALLIGWALIRLGAVLPRDARGSRHPAYVWAIALPVWIALSALAEWLVPAASYLWTIPLLTASLVILALPIVERGAARIGSAIVLASVGALWAQLSFDLLGFAVAVFGRLPVITPIVVYPAMLAVAITMVAPPLIAMLLAPDRPLARPSIVTASLLLAFALATAAAYTADAYTAANPLRRSARYVSDASTGRAYFEVASNEPGLDLPTADAPGGWQRLAGPPDAGGPIPRLPGPFVFRAPAPPAIAPVEIRSSLEPRDQGIELEIAARALDPGAAVRFVLPPGVRPARANLPGVVRRDGSWAATFVAPPAEGVAFRATFRRADEAALARAAVVVVAAGLPGGTGWQRLPAWIPRGRATWTARSWYIVPAGPRPPLAPPVPLR